MSIKFDKVYFLIFASLFIIEALIATFFKTGFIRHTFGDFLVVILIYCFIKSFTNLKPKTAGLIVLIVAFSIEFLQLFNILKVFGLQNSYTAKLIFGSTFNITDLIAYMLGIIVTLMMEKIFKSNP